MSIFNRMLVRCWPNGPGPAGRCSRRPTGHTAAGDLRYSRRPDVNVLALARMLGHKDPSVTLRVYADLFDTDLDAVAVALHRRYSGGCVQNVLTGANRES
jgi:hypothetical protein